MGQGSAGESWWGRFKTLVKLEDHRTHKEGVSALGVVETLVVSVVMTAILLFRLVNEVGVGRSVSVRTITVAGVAIRPTCTVILACWYIIVMVYGMVTGAWRFIVVAHADSVSCIWWGRTSLPRGSWDGLVKLRICVSSSSHTVRLTDLTGELDHASPRTFLDLQMEGEGVGTFATGTREGEVVVVWTGVEWSGVCWH